MDRAVLKMSWPGAAGPEAEAMLEREWLVTNGLGGYAAGTVPGVPTRRYHGLLISALPAPLGRTMMLNHLREQATLPDGSSFRLSGLERRGRDREAGMPDCLAEFRLEEGLPVWRYQLGKAVLEKRVIMPHGQNSVYLHYRMLSGPGKIRLLLAPAVHLRSHESPVSEQPAEPHRWATLHGGYELSADPRFPPLRMALYAEGASFAEQEEHVPDVLYRSEENRGYEALGTLWSPGSFLIELSRGVEATLVASTERWEVLRTLSPAEALESERERRRRLLVMATARARTGLAAELVLAADQFIIVPAGRVQDAARSHAAGDGVRTVIAGYHWFTDWGRDTMISLEGLTLTTGRHLEGGYILRTFAHYIRDGLIPNMFPEEQVEGRYNTADATLWYFHAVDRYLEYTGDRETLRILLPRLLGIVDRHLRGTRFGIRVDPADGLLIQGVEGLPLTWMDAHVGDWVVTPRRGKAVEINALWYNALRLLERWVREEQGEEPAQPLADQAARVRRAFNQRFWYAEGGYLYDIVDGEQGDDPSCRPNQVLAIALRHPVLDRSRWESVLQVVLERLLTPVGLRSLAPGEPDYRPKYFGDRRTRDAAYHQGTVWGWLIGPFVDAWLKLYPADRTGARRFLEGFQSHFREAAVGSVSEVFDAQKPFTPRGCVAQAWSVAELLRCWVKTAE